MKHTVRGQGGQGGKRPGDRVLGAGAARRTRAALGSLLVAAAVAARCAVGLGSGGCQAWPSGCAFAGSRSARWGTPAASLHARPPPVTRPTRPRLSHGSLPPGAPAALQVLKELAPYKNFIVSTGGGAVTVPANWSYMHNGIVAWLEGDAPLLARRVVAEGVEKRPLLYGDGVAREPARGALGGGSAAGACAAPRRAAPVPKPRPPSRREPAAPRPRPLLGRRAPPRCPQPNHRRPPRPPLPAPPQPTRRTRSRSPSWRRWARRGRSITSTPTCACRWAAPGLTRRRARRQRS